MSPLRALPRLRPGDMIGIAALSGPADPIALEAGEARLRLSGYRVRRAANVLATEPVLGLAGDEATRVAGYRDLLLDPDVKAIVFSRGGYGITPLLNRLDAAEVAAHPKIHCGFSDLTALHAFLLERCGLPSFHGPMVAADLARGLEPPGDLFFPAALEGRAPAALEVPGADVVTSGTATGRLVGGCLSLLAAQLGAPDEFDYSGALLFLEDVAEEAYRIDRMLVALERAGRFAKLAGVIVGSMSGITFGGREAGERLRAVLERRFAPLGVPCALGLPFGHRGPNVALPVGARASWDSESRVLRFEEEIVA